MFGDHIYPTKYSYGKTIDRFGRMKFWLSQNLLFYAKTYAASGECKMELLIIVSDFMMNSRLKNTLDSIAFLWNSWNVLIRMCS